MDNFLQFVKDNHFLQGYKPPKKEEQKKKPTNPPPKDLFLKYLNDAVVKIGPPQREQDLDSFQREDTQSSINQEFNEWAIVSEFQKTTKEKELRQQKKILLLHQKIHNLEKEIHDYKKQNQELHHECKLQREQIIQGKKEKIAFEENRRKQEGLVEYQRKNISENDALIKVLKPVLSQQMDDLEKIAFVQIKQSMSLQDRQQLTNQINQQIQGQRQNQNNTSLKKFTIRQNSIRLSNHDNKSLGKSNTQISLKS